MPAITLAPPEAGYFGYDRVLAAADPGYRGRPFNWITMPDQFALASLERQSWTGSRGRRSLVEAALIVACALIRVPPMLPGRIWGRPCLRPRCAGARRLRPVARSGSGAVRPVSA